MKKHIFKFTFAGLLALGIVACKDKKEPVSDKQEVTTQSEGVEYKIDTAESKVEWKGYKVLKLESTSHFGTLQFKEGSVTVKDNLLESGKFTVDVNSLHNIDIREKDEKSAQQLEGHLKSGDFFEVEKYPVATFEITKISHPEKSDYNTLLEGNLTIKAITKPISFLANVNIEGGKVSIATESKDINREDFGINFKAPAENGILKNEITLQILVKAQETK